MGLHFHRHGKDVYIEKGRQEALANPQSSKNPYDRLNTELEQHILAAESYVKAAPAKREVSDAAQKLRQAVHALRHPKKHVAEGPRVKIK
jgi:prefoldin subunit 5